MQLKTINFIFSFILILLPVCSNDQKNIFGIWQSISITNPDPLFKKTLPNTQYGSVQITFKKNGTFVWIDTSESKQLTGTFQIKNNTLITMTINKETVPVNYTLSKNKLILRTNDGFIFTFKKEK